MSRQVEVVNVSLDRLKEVIREVLGEDRRREEQGAQAMSASKAARLAGCRDAYLLAALNSGALKGHKKGKRWAVLAKDISAWVSAGKVV